jgi:hypothetical protein
MFELIEPMGVIQPKDDSVLNSDAHQNLNKLFGDEISTESQQILDILFSGSED